MNSVTESIALGLTWRHKTQETIWASSFVPPQRYRTFDKMINCSWAFLESLFRKRFRIHYTYFAYFRNFGLVTSQLNKKYSHTITACFIKVLTVCFKVSPPTKWAYLINKVFKRVWKCQQEVVNVKWRKNRFPVVRLFKLKCFKNGSSFNMNRRNIKST